MYILADCLMMASGTESFRKIVIMFSENWKNQFGQLEQNSRPILHIFWEFIVFCQFSEQPPFQ